MKYLKLLSLFLVTALIFSCSKKDDDENKNTDTPGTLGAVGNEWKAKFNDEHTIGAKIIENNDGQLNLDGEIDTVKLDYQDNVINEFIHSNGDISKPFTMVEFDAKVGDVYLFNMGDLWFERYVIEIESYHIDCLGRELETIGVYESIPYEIDFKLFGYTIREIYWYWHETYGLVCVEVYTEEGDYFEFTFLSIDLK